MNVGEFLDELSAKDRIIGAQANIILSEMFNEEEITSLMSRPLRIWTIRKLSEAFEMCLSSRLPKIEDYWDKNLSEEEMVKILENQRALITWSLEFLKKVFEVAKDLGLSYKDAEEQILIGLLLMFVAREDMLFSEAREQIFRTFGYYPSSN